MLPYCLASVLGAAFFCVFFAAPLAALAGALAAALAFMAGAAPACEAAWALKPIMATAAKMREVSSLLMRITFSGLNDFVHVNWGQLNFLHQLGDAL